MSNEDFPLSVGEALETLKEIFDCRNNKIITTLLNNSRSFFDEINYDNWNGGTYTWCLFLEAPVPLFIDLEKNKSKIEVEICKELQNIVDIRFSNHHIEEVKIIPLTSSALLSVQRSTPSDAEVRRL